MTEQEIKQVQSGEVSTVYHRLHGRGTVVAVREDKLAGMRPKATIEFIIPDLLEDRVQPEFLYLDDKDLSLTEWQ